MLNLRLTTATSRRLAAARPTTRPLLLSPLTALEPSLQQRYSSSSAPPSLPSFRWNSSFSSSSASVSHHRRPVANDDISRAIVGVRLQQDYIGGRGGGVRWFSSTEEKIKKDSEGEEAPAEAAPETNRIKEEEESETEEAAPKKKKKKGSLRDTVNRLKSDGDESSSSSSSTAGGGGVDTDEVLRQSRTVLSSFMESVNQTWQELLAFGRPEDINKKIGGASGGGTGVAEDDDEAADKYEGSMELAVYEGEGTAWERMQRRLSEAPIIQDILDKSQKLYEQSGAQKVKERVSDLQEDAREAWETSQNPWVYRLSSVYDTLTAESEYAIAVTELRKLDPNFTLEKWKHDVVEHTIPRIMELFLEGRIKELKPWLGESVYNRLAAEIRARKKEGVQIDTHVLGIMNSDILACEMDEVNKGSPIILLHYMCQQINCVRKKEDGSIVEGSEDDIRANSYVVAFQREHDEMKGELNWKIIDFRFNGAIAYI